LFWTVFFLKSLFTAKNYIFLPKSGEITFFKDFFCFVRNFLVKNLRKPREKAAK
jgi:hypothetical protein